MNRYIVIPDNQVTLFRRRIDWFNEIEPIRTKSGSWVLPVSVFNIKSLDQPVEIEEKEVNLKTELDRFQKIPLTVQDFPEPIPDPDLKTEKK